MSEERIEFLGKIMGAEAQPLESALSDNKVMFLTTIAQAKNMKPEEALAALIPHITIYAYLENLTHINGREVTNPDGGKLASSIGAFPILPPYLHVIFSKGAWEGNKIRVPSFDVNGCESRNIELTFGKDIRLSLQDLFVYEHDLVELESRVPDIATVEPATSPRLEESLYTLIGVLLDMLVDRRDKVLPLPEGGSGYIFQSQAALIAHIDEKYDFRGLKKSSLEAKFSKANAILQTRNKD